MMMYTIDLPRSQYEICDTCPSDIEVPTNPPPRIFSRQLLGYLFELRVQDSHYAGLLELKNCVMEQLDGADRNDEILRRIHFMFPVVMRVGGSIVTLSPMFLKLLRDRLVILLNICVRRRQQRRPPPPRRLPIPASALPPSRRQYIQNRHAMAAARKRQEQVMQTWSIYDLFNIIPTMLYTMRDWFYKTFDTTIEFDHLDDSSDDEMST